MPYARQFKMPASAGGHTIVVERLSVERIFGIEDAHLSGLTEPGKLTSARRKATRECHQAALVGIDGAYVPEAEREAAYHKLGPKGAAFLASAYFSMHGVTEDEEADFFETEAPVELTGLKGYKG